MRLTEREGEALLREGDLIALGREADKIRQQRFGNTTQHQLHECLRQ